MAMSMVAITISLFGAIILNANIDTQDSWPDGAATGNRYTLAALRPALPGLLLGVNGALFIMYGAMLSHYQLPFICKYLVPVR